MLFTYLNSETFISCLQAEAVAIVRWEANRGEPFPGMEIRDGLPALQEVRLGSKLNLCRPPDPKVEKPKIYRGCWVCLIF